MPANTANRGYPYPLPADPVDVNGDIQRLAEAINDDLITVNDLIVPRKAAQARSSQSLVVQPNVLQTLVPFDTLDWDTSSDADRYFRLTNNPYTLTLVPGLVYWVYASIRFPSVNNTAPTGDICRIEIISPTPSGTFVLCDNAYTEDTLIDPDLVHAASLVQPTNVNNQWRVSVRHNSGSSRVFTQASFGVFQV